MRRSTFVLTTLVFLLSLNAGCYSDDGDGGTDTDTGTDSDTDSDTDSETDTDSESETETDSDTDDDIDTDFVPSPGCPVFVTEAGSDELDGSSWDDAKATVTDGISAAKQLVDEDNKYTNCEVWVAQGTYYPTDDTNRERSFRLKDGVHLYGGFVGDETALEQRDFENNATVLSGDIGTPGNDHDNSVHVVRCNVEADCQHNVIIDGFTISDGCTHASNDFDPSSVDGAGMYNVGSSPLVRNCIFENNKAQNSYAHTPDGSGGGMHNSLASPIIMNCTFRNNLASYSGGAIRNSGSTPTIIDSIFEGNEVYGDADGYGAGISNSFHTSLTIIDCVFGNNLAYADGDGIYSINSSATVINCRFLGNQNPGGSGDGIYHSGTDPLVVINSLFFIRQGSGILLYSSSVSSITNCTFVRNSQYSSMSGLRIYYSSPTITGCVFDNFPSDSWDPIYTYSTDSDPSNPIISYSNVEGGCDAIEGAICGEGNIDEDPLFVDLENGDFHLQAGSPCIDTGLNEALPLDEFDLDDDKDTDELVPYDLDGNNRIVNKIVDMGAYEFQK